MLKNIYTPLSGALAQEKVLDIIANNLANVSTPGFKGEDVSFKLLESEPERTYKEPLPPANYKIDLEKHIPLRGNEFAYVGVSGVVRDDRQGSPVQTRNPLDIMLEGRGYLGVNTPSGVRYTRNGSLSLTSQGVLADWQGNPILGEKGNIFVRQGKVDINKRGEVYLDGEFVDRLKIYDFEDPKLLEKVGSNKFIYNGLSGTEKVLKQPTVRQGYIEASNVNAIKNLTDMILAHRSYEAYQKAIKNMDSMMDKSANTIGNLSG